MKVVLVPMRVRPGNFTSNWREFRKRFSEAVAHRPDFIVFPEYCLTGFRQWDFTPAKYYGEIIEKVSGLAAKHRVHVILGMLEPCGRTAYNTAVLIGRDGKVILKHRKLQEPMKFCRGNTFRTASTEFGTVGIVICGDLYNDEVKEMVLRSRPDHLFVPMDYSPEHLDLEEEIRVMGSRVRELGVMTYIVNTYQHDGSFGGAWVFDPEGNLIAQSVADQALFVNLK